MLHAVRLLLFVDSFSVALASKSAPALLTTISSVTSTSALSNTVAAAATAAATRGIVCHVQKGAAVPVLAHARLEVTAGLGAIVVRQRAVGPCTATLLEPTHHSTAVEAAEASASNVA